MAKACEERLSSLTILRVHKHTNVDIDKVVSEFSRHFRGPKNKKFPGEYAQTSLVACAFGACFTMPSCAYLNGKTTLRP